MVLLNITTNTLTSFNRATLYGLSFCVPLVEWGVSLIYDFLSFEDLLNHATYSWDNYIDSLGEVGFSVSYLADSFIEIEDVVGDNLDLGVIVENITNANKKVA